MVVSPCQLRALGWKAQHMQWHMQKAPRKHTRLCLFQEDRMMNFECSIVHIILNDDAVVKLGIFYEHKNHKQNFSKILLIIICSYNVFFFF
mmetsp:Transcript_8653/g.13286  ORF Transcript_8653/g.13286 Transcript_8653/m.13286 type:complete len:91 (+) Transcript_8653:117-389(+)